MLRLTTVVRCRLCWATLLATATVAPGLAACGGGPTASLPGLSPSASPSPSRSTAAPTPTPSQTPAPPSACPSDNTLFSWWYVPNEAHRTPGIPDEARRLIDAYGAFYVGDTSERAVYLTFDEGYENGFTGPILDALRVAGVKGTFFVTASYVRANPRLVRRMVDEGHIVADHTDSHPSLPSLAFDRGAFARELTAVDDAFREVTGEEMVHLLRPPMGEYSARSLCLSRRLGYTTVFWSFAHRDWLVDDQPPVDVTLRRLLDGRHNGAIYLLHAVSRSDTEALPTFIAEMRTLGYRFGALTELAE